MQQEEEEAVHQESWTLLWFNFDHSEHEMVLALIH